MARAYPDYPMVSCHALIRRGEHLLLIRRARPPLAGRWGLPGGGVELGETVEECLHREALEETGLTISKLQFLGYQDAITPEPEPGRRIQYHYVILFFVAWADQGVVTPGDDAAEARWLTAAEARGLSLTDSAEWCMQRAGVFDERGAAT